MKGDVPPRKKKERVMEQNFNNTEVTSTAQLFVNQKFHMEVHRGQGRL